ncbi:zip-like iron-zinc transporter [Pseudohyphozyma bogoriensis]|nr:zip-like iron-zinc transporter [Pseudohyphozyma bogoriensis]
MSAYMDANSSDDPCGPTPTTRLGLRIAAIFVILITSMMGTFFPIAAKRITWLRHRVPGELFEFAKYFGSGVILATGLVHLLEPAADDEIGAGNTISNGGCIADAWGEYPYAFGLCLLSLFITFIVHVVTFRLGHARLLNLGIDLKQDVHPHGAVMPPSPGETERAGELSPASTKISDDESQDALFQDSSESSPVIAQIISVGVLEFGIVFHSVIIGMTLSVSGADEFVTLFVVIIFHQSFEGLGLGARLAFLQLPENLWYIPYIGAALYSIVTPLGMAIGLGVRTSLSMTSAASSITSGVFDSVSAGILIYTSCVELMAHEFIFNMTFHKCSWGKLWFVLGSFGAGAGLMALLAKWA